MRRRERIQELVFVAIDELNRHRQAHEKMVKSPDARILGQGSALDSMGLVTLSVDIEERILKEFGTPTQLVANIFGKGEVASINDLTILIDSLLNEH